MFVRHIIVYVLFKCIHANRESDVIFDYFVHRQVSSIVGFSCNSIEDDTLLLRRFSDEGCFSVLCKIDIKMDINMLANSVYSKVGIFVDTRCYALESIAAVLTDATNSRMFYELYYWFILGHKLEKVLSVVNDAAFGISTDFVIAVSEGPNNYKLYDVYNAFKNRGGILNVTHCGYWEKKNGLTLKPSQIKSIARGNLNGMTLKAMFFQSAYRPPDTPLEKYYLDTSEGTRDGRSKFGYIILSHLGDIYNFSIECSETKNWIPGDALGPLTRAMMNFEIDLTGTPLSVNSKRTLQIKFLHEDWPFRTCFMFRNPQPRTIKVDEVLRPFEKRAWYLIAFIILLSMMLLSLALHHDHKSADIINVTNSFTMIIGAICQQCTCVNMQRLSTRIIFFFTMLFSLLIYSYYSACVVSARLDEPIYKINDSLLEMVKIQMKMASERMVYLEYFFKVRLRFDKNVLTIRYLKAPFWEIQEFHRNYWLKLPESERFMEPENGMALVQKGGFAYHVHPDVAYTLIEKSYNNREICELMEVHLSKPQNTMFGVNNNCTYSELVRVGLTKISEVGLRRRQLIKWQYRKPRCRHDILSASSVDIYEFAPHLILLLIGLLLAVFVYVFETNGNRKRINFYTELYFRNKRLILKKKLFVRRTIV